jgi:hypothetical protein
MPDNLKEVGMSYKWLKIDSYFVGIFYRGLIPRPGFALNPDKPKSAGGWLID